MKKQSYIIFIAIGLLLLSLYFFYGSKNATTVGRMGKYLETRDTAAVDWIKIVGRDQVEMKRRDTIWELNDEWQADQMAMSNFLFVFNRIQIRGVAGDFTVEKDSPRFTIHIGENRKKRVIHYYPVNGMDLIRKEGSDRFFLVEVSGFPDIKLPEVISDSPFFWRSRLLFSMRPEEIAEISLHYRKSPEKDFTVLNAGDSILIYDPVDNYFYPSHRVNTEKLRMFMSYFMNIFFEEFLVETHRRDSVLKLIPEMQIHLEGIDGKRKSIDMWPVYNGEIRDERYIYLRRDNDNEILVGKHILTDMWGKEKADFLIK